MQSVVKILIIFWFGFLSAPTIISLVADEDRSAITITVAEEENQNEVEQKSYEETQKIFLFHTTQLFASLRVKSAKKLVYAHNKKIVTVFEEIFSPPPELI
jgi:hypothetical protein